VDERERRGVKWELAHLKSLEGERKLEVDVVVDNSAEGD